MPKQNTIIYFYYQFALRKLKDLAESKLNIITIRRRINAHETQKILRGKPQLKTPLSVLSYKVEIHRNYTKP